MRWVAENKRPFQIVNDRGFRVLMKTGRPDYHIPSAQTLSRDVRNVFVRVRKRIGRILQVSKECKDLIQLLTRFKKEYDGRLSFATDAWTSPNHKAYVAITVHLEQKGEALAMLLDIVEVPKSHTGSNLAIAFVKVLEDFGISNKVGMIYKKENECSPFQLDPGCDR